MRRIYKGLGVAGGAIGLSLLGGFAESYGSAIDSSSLTLAVDCANGEPSNVAIAGGLNDSQEINITAQTPQGHINLTAELGKYSLVGVERTRHPAGQVLANLGSAVLIAGAPNTEANTYYQADQSVTLICNGVQPKNATSGSGS